MVEFANTSATPNLLSARNVIITVSAVMIISLLWECFTILKPNDSDGRARDSFGTRGDGYRALYEILESLHVPVERDWTTPQFTEDLPATFVLLAPDREMVLNEPTYLKSLLKWVDAGGRLIVAPMPPVDIEARRDRNVDLPGEPDILRALELGDVVFLDDEELNSTGSENPAFQTHQPPGGHRQYVLRNWWDRTTPVPREINVEANGTLAQLANTVSHLAVPAEGVRTLVAGGSHPGGTIQYRHADGKVKILAAQVRRKKGEIIVLSDPAIVSNRQIAHADNSVLALRLFSPNNETVRFDEYYHGLAVRGNPFYLLTRPGFAAVAAAIGLVLSILVWRKAVFLGPPLPAIGSSRRDIREYIHAMANFFCLGEGHRRFLVEEVRRGVLEALCQQLHLPPHTADIDKIAAFLERKSLARANRFRAAIAIIDQQLARPREFPKSTIVQSVQQLASCL